ncbi:MAG: hypothetical protein ABMA15_27510 [Vicinamibacterales bacterium]
MRRSILLVILPLLLLVPSRSAQASGFWDWMQEWSGPGPFVGKGHHPPILVNLCPEEYRAVGSPADSRSCLYFDLRRLETDANDNFPVPVSVTLVDVGVTTKAHVWRLRDSVEVGYGVGLMRATSGELGTLGGKTMTKFTFTVPRVTVKPLIAIVEIADRDQQQGRSTARKLLSVPKAFLGASVIAGTMNSEQLGVPDGVHHFSNSWEVVLSRGIFFDFGELFTIGSKRLVPW